MLTYYLGRRKAFSVQHPVKHANTTKTHGVMPLMLTDIENTTNPSSQVSSQDTAEEALEHAGRDVSSVNCILTLSASILIQVESTQRGFFDNY